MVEGTVPGEGDPYKQWEQAQAWVTLCAGVLLWVTFVCFMWGPRGSDDPPSWLLCCAIGCSLLCGLVSGTPSGAGWHFSVQPEPVALGLHGDVSPSVWVAAALTRSY